MQGFDADAFFAFVGQRGHGGLLGLALADYGAEWAALTIGDGAHLAGPGGGIAAGAVLGMMDMATSMAVWARRGRFAPHVTLDLRLDWLRDPGAGPYAGRGECHAIDGNLAFVRGTVDDGDTAAPFATVTGTFMLLETAP